MTASAPKNGKVVLLGSFPPPYGGVSIYNENLRRLLLEAQYAVTTLQYDPYELRGAAQARTLRENAALFSPETVCLDSARWLLEEPAIGNPLGYFYGVPLTWLRLKQTRRFRWIKIVHDGTLPERFPHFRPAQRFVFRQALRWLDTLVVVSEALQQWFVDTAGYTKPIHVIPSLLPIRVPAPRPHSEKETQTVCAIGIFTPNYGFLELATAVEALRAESGRNIELLLVDGGFGDDTNYRSKTLQNRDWIRIRREIPHEETLQILHESDVFVRPLQNESYGLSRVEALWCGTPVVATKVGEQRGMRLFDFGDEEGLVRQLRDVLNAPPVQEIAQWARFYEQEACENLYRMQCLTDKEAVRRTPC